MRAGRRIGEIWPLQNRLFLTFWMIFLFLTSAFEGWGLGLEFAAHGQCFLRVGAKPSPSEPSQAEPIRADPSRSKPS